MNQHNNQAKRILKLLREHHGNWVPLPEILGLMIGSHTRRIHELRKQGHKIEMVDEWVGRQRHTRYRLIERKPHQQLLIQVQS